MMKKGIYLLALFLFIFSSVGAYRAEAAAQMELSSRIEGVLVVDVSKSMLSSDPNGLSNEAMKMFVDMSSIKGDKIGVIAYGNDVESKKELTKIRSEADKQAIKSFIDSLGKYNNTDISVGVAEALKFLDTGHESGYIPLVVVLADGNNDLDKTKPKTNQQADEQLAQSVVDAKVKGYPIYVIGLNADGKLNKQLLQNIAARTNGKFFETNNATDLPGILSEIFADHLKLKMVPVKDVTATEEFQDVPFTVPNENVLEANISLISNKPVELKLVAPSGKELAIPSDNITVTKSKNYSMLKLLNPIQGNWTLKVKGFPQDKVDVKLVFNNDLQLKLASLAKNIKAGDTVKIEAFFEDNGKKIVNKGLYPTLKAGLYVKNSVSGKIEEIPLKAGENRFFGEYKAGDSGMHEVTVRAEGNSFYRETKPQTIKVTGAGGINFKPVGGHVKAAMTEKPSTLPWIYAVTGAAAILLLVILGYSYCTKRRKKNRGFSGQLVVEVKDENTGESTVHRVKKLKAFKGEFHLRQLFKLDQEFSGTDQITFVAITDNTLLLLNKSNCTIDMGGELIDAETGHRLRRNDKLCIHLPEFDKAIYIENIS